MQSPDTMAHELQAVALLDEVCMLVDSDWPWADVRPNAIEKLLICACWACFLLLIHDSGETAEAHVGHRKRLLDRIITYLWERVGFWLDTHLAGKVQVEHRRIGQCSTLVRQISYRIAVCAMCFVAEIACLTAHS